MPERAMLREYFAEMREVAEAAAGSYERAAESYSDPAAQETLRRIAMDTSRHIELTDRLLEIIDE